MNPTFLKYIFVFAIAFPAFSQQYDIQWIKSFSGERSEYLRGMHQNHENNTVMLIESNSTEGIYSNNFAGEDIFFFEVDNEGNLLKNFNYGGLGDESARDMLVTCDGYIISGGTRSIDGEMDAWIFKINQQGEMLWEIDLGGTTYETATGIEEVAPGIYFSSIFTKSNNQDFEHAKEVAFYSWFLLFNDKGEIVWLKQFPLANSAIGRPLVIENDLYLVGSSESPLPASWNSFFHRSDLAILKMSMEGDSIWHKTYGGSWYDNGNFILPTRDGNLMVIGRTESDDRDVPKNNLSVDLWVLKIDRDGNLIDSKIFGGTYNDYFTDYSRNFDGTYKFMMSAGSADFTDQTGIAMVLFNIDENLEIDQKDVFQIDSLDRYSGEMTRINENTLMVGIGNVIDHSNLEDVHLMKLVKPVPENPSISLVVYPNPATDCITFYSENVEYPFRIKLFDMAGRLVAEYPVSSNYKTIDVADFPTGAYIYDTDIDLDAGVFLKY